MFGFGYDGLFLCCIFVFVFELVNISYFLELKEIYLGFFMSIFLRLFLIFIIIDKDSKS